MQQHLSNLTHKTRQKDLQELVAALPEETQPPTTTTRWSQESRKQAQSRLLCQQGKQAMSWLNTDPDTNTTMHVSSTTIPPGEFTAALRRNFGMHTSYTDLPVSCPAGCTARNVPQSATTLHAAYCPNSGLSTTAHHFFAFGLQTIMRQMGMGAVQRESRTCFTTATAQRRDLRMDLVVPANGFMGCGLPDFDGQQVLLDVTISHPCTPTNIRSHHTDVVAGAMNTIATDRKHRTYAGTYAPAIATLKCFGMETYGRLATEAEETLQAMVHRATRDVLAGDVTPTRARVIGRLRQRISCLLQRTISRREIQYAGIMRLNGVDGARHVAEMGGHSPSSSPRRFAPAFLGEGRVLGGWAT
jgi:hypothetical protein